MPKFIWVGELTTKALLKQDKATGLVILDATEPNMSYYKPVILTAYDGFILKLNQVDGSIEKDVLPLHPFKCFCKNLKTQ
jgi:hypothetical protein